MKRDFDLVRKILIDMEGCESGYVGNLEIEGYTEDQILHHVYLMGQANLLEIADITSIGSESPQALPLSITWSGHDFLDAMRDDTIWNKAKEKVLMPAGKAAVGASFSVLLGWLKYQAAEKLGIPPNLTSN